MNQCDFEEALAEQKEIEAQPTIRLLQDRGFWDIKYVRETGRFNAWHGNSHYVGLYVEDRKVRMS